MQDLGPFGQFLGTFGLGGSLRRIQSLQQIEVAIELIGLEIAQVRKQGVARLLAAEPVQRAVRQDALEQHGQLFDRLMAVVLHQLHHAVLDDIQCRFVIAHVVNRTLERALFDAFQKI